MPPPGDARPRAETHRGWLLAIAKNGNDAGGLHAISTLVDRLYGRPKESVTVETEESDGERALRELTPEQQLDSGEGAASGTSTSRQEETA
jgi:hypothetical protein